MIFRFTGELGEKKGSVGRNKNNISILMISFNHRQLGCKEESKWTQYPKLESDCTDHHSQYSRFVQIVSVLPTHKSEKLYPIYEHPIF